MDKEKVLSLLKRVRTSPDGPEFIEYLESLSRDNYRFWKKSVGEDAFVKQGYAICIDSLLESFAECTKETINDTKGIVDWS